MVANWPAYVLRWFFFSLKCSQFGIKSLLPHSLWKWENSFKQSNIYFLYNNFPLVLFWEQTSINIWTFKSIFCVWLYFINKCCCNFHTICKKKKKKIPGYFYSWAKWQPYEWRNTKICFSIKIHSPKNMTF